MTVTELLAAMLAVYPGATGEAMKAIKGAYYTRLRRHEGAALEAAANEVLATFKPKYGQPFPIPGDFEAHLPTFGLIIGGKGKTSEWGPPIDIPGRNRRAESLFANWQQGQCRRADKGNPLLRRALEFVARPIADTLAWNDNPEPLILTREQIRTAYQRAISVERRQRYGKPPSNRYLWWQQIQSVATEWDMQLTPEQWDDETAKWLAIPQDHAG